MDKTVTTRIDQERCTGCGLCVEVCPSGTITMKGKKASVSGAESLNCGHCAAVCPSGAVQVTGLDPTLSTFKTFEARESWLPHGQGTIQDLVHIMQSRRSCRNFKTEKPVPKDLLEDLIKIGVSAPSGSNCQLWSFTILSHREAVLRLAKMVGGFFQRLNRTAEKGWLRKILRLIGKPELEVYYREYYRRVRDGLEEWENEGTDILFHGAPAAIVVGSKRHASCPAEDALLASQNILLGAHVLGLGTCLIGFAIEAMRRDKSILRRLGMPDDERAYAVIALGYPDEKYRRVAGRKQALVRYFEEAAGK
ncbi:MAG: nitroreductase [Deltaproteobacteria bacterium HGW-Deltaproteobacteria-21]|nr:MAG: nitroreductase [Deltaproteobacteria bacterium HGW-Deltaproteobacteria-21]